MMTLVPLCRHRLLLPEGKLSGCIHIHNDAFTLAELALKQLQGQRVLQVLLASCILPHVC